MSDELKLVERGPRAKKEYKPRFDRVEYLALLGFDAAEQSFAQLSDDELKFVCEMVSNGCDKVKAFRTVYSMDSKLTETQYHKIGNILRKEEVKQLLRAGIQRKMAESLDNLDAQLLDAYITRAFYDPADFLDDDGEPKNLSQIEPRLRCVVDGVEKKYFGKDAEVYTITLKLANRDQALKVLSEYMGNLRPSSDVVLTNPGKANDEDETERLSEMSYEELQAEMKRLKA